MRTLMGPQPRTDNLHLSQTNFTLSKIREITNINRSHHESLNLLPQKALEGPPLCSTMQVLSSCKIFGLQQELPIPTRSYFRLFPRRRDSCSLHRIRKEAPRITRGGGGSLDSPLQSHKPTKPRRRSTRQWGRTLLSVQVGKKRICIRIP